LGAGACGMSDRTKKETIEEFLARGGAIKKIDPVPEDKPITKSKIKGWQKSVTQNKGKMK
jgi:hypothetical protein